MQSITFNQDGGPINVTLSAGQAQPGSYELRLWEAGTNQIVLQKQGNFLNDADDAYPLPTPNSQNNGRLVQAIMTIALLPPISNYSAAVTIEQDGKTLGKIPISGTSNEPSVILNLYATLVADAQSTEGNVAEESGTTDGTTSGGNA